MAPSNTAGRKPPRISAPGAKFATVIVGIEKISFVVHEQLLTYHSPFFRAALEGGFAEAAEGKVRLEKVHKNTFELVVHWLYHQRFPNDDDDAELLKLWYYDHSTEVHAGRLIGLHIFAEEYHVPELKRQSLDTLFELLQYDDQVLLDPTAIRCAFDTLDDESSLCRLLVDSYCEWSDEDAWDEVCDDTNARPHPVFIKKALKRFTKYTDVIGRDAHACLILCDYHDHKDIEERNACAAKMAAKRAA